MTNQENTRLYFASDYMEGAHPAILQRLTETNMEHSPGYGMDSYSESARKKIREACSAPDADVFFLTGGTQTNATVIDALLRPYQGVIAADTGHISVHEAGAIESGGHKVLTLPQLYGKLSPEAIERCIEAYRLDQNRAKDVEHISLKVYKLAEDGSMGMASAAVAPTESEEGLRKTVADLVYQAGLVKNKPYRLNTPKAFEPVKTALRPLKEEAESFNQKMVQVGGVLSRTYCSLSSLN